MVRHNVHAQISKFVTNDAVHQKLNKNQNTVRTRCSECQDEHCIPLQRQRGQSLEEVLPEKLKNKFSIIL